MMTFFNSLNWVRKCQFPSSGWKKIFTHVVSGKLFINNSFLRSSDKFKLHKSSSMAASLKSLEKKISLSKEKIVLLSLEEKRVGKKKAILVLPKRELALTHSALAYLSIEG